MSRGLEGGGGHLQWFHMLSIGSNMAEDTRRTTQEQGRKQHRHIIEQEVSAGGVGVSTGLRQESRSLKTNTDHWADAYSARSGLTLIRFKLHACV